MSSEGDSHGAQPGGAATVSNREPTARKKGKSAVGAGKMAERAIARGGAVASGHGGRRSFFEYYKRGQGNWTRYGTAMGGGILILTGCHFILRQLEAVLDASKPWTLYVRVGIPVAVLLTLAILLWWIVGVNRKSGDFMIATEGEMKKVSWSSKKELVGSTKVVILFTILLAIILFVVDLGFMQFFRWINVLRV